MTDQDPAHALQQELHTIVKHRHPDPTGAIHALIDSNDPTLEDGLWLIARDWQSLRVREQSLARWILVERDRDRDPAPFLEPMGPPRSRPRKPAPTGLARLMHRAVIDLPPILEAGVEVSRLRRLDPVRTLARILEEDERWVARIAATTQLGLTGELDALDPLTLALDDRRQYVRLAAISGIRRMRHSGADAIFHSHPVRDALIEALDDPKRRVRVAAAHALGAYGDLEPVRLRRLGSWRDRRELDRILAGRIRPLEKKWPGDNAA